MRCGGEGLLPTPDMAPRNGSVQRFGTTTDTTTGKLGILGEVLQRVG